MSRNSRDEELGALWIKNGANGEFFTGTIKIGREEADVVVFPNRYKEKDNQPDYRILRSRPREDRDDRGRRDTGRHSGGYDRARDDRAPSERARDNDRGRRYEGYRGAPEGRQDEPERTSADRHPDDDIPF